jgi:hypothetical protein
METLKPQEVDQNEQMELCSRSALASKAHVQRYVYVFFKDILLIHFSHTDCRKTVT